LLTPATGVGVGIGVGVATGVGVGATVNTAGLVVETGVPVAVWATLGVIETVYWVLGAKLPTTGLILRVLPAQSYLTSVAGVIWTALSVEGWSMGWLKVTSSGLTAATGVYWLTL
jgi:hypothetical protein